MALENSQGPTNLPYHKLTNQLINNYQQSQIFHHKTRGKQGREIMPCAGGKQVCIKVSVPDNKATLLLKDLWLQRLTHYQLYST
jgi:hypothetical protein